MPAVPAPIPSLNVFGRTLRYFAPGVGYLRLGYCNYTSLDPTPHTIAAIVTKEFLEFTRSRGNDLITPRLEYGFWGLTDGCRWCIGTQRWLEAFKARKELGDSIVPRVVLEATALQTLSEVPMDALEQFSIEDEALTELFPFSSR